MRCWWIGESHRIAGLGRICPHEPLITIDMTESPDSDILSHSLRFQAKGQANHASKVQIAVMPGDQGPRMDRIGREVSRVCGIAACQYSNALRSKHCMGSTCDLLPKSRLPIMRRLWHYLTRQCDNATHDQDFGTSECDFLECCQRMSKTLEGSKGRWVLQPSNFWRRRPLLHFDAFWHFFNRRFMHGSCQGFVCVCVVESFRCWSRRIGQSGFQFHVSSSSQQNKLANERKNEPSNQHTSKRASRQAGKQASKQASTQADKQTSRQADKQTRNIDTNERLLEQKTKMLETSDKNRKYGIFNHVLSDL